MPLHVPSKLIIFVSTIVSTFISLLAGYLLYAESISVLRSAVEENSSGASKSARFRLAGMLESVVESTHEALLLFNRSDVMNFSLGIEYIRNIYNANRFAALRSTEYHYGGGYFIAKLGSPPWEDIDGYGRQYVWYDPVLEVNGSEAKYWLESKVVGQLNSSNTSEIIWTRYNTAMDNETGASAPEVFSETCVEDPRVWLNMMATVPEEGEWTPTYFWNALDGTPYPYTGYRSKHILPVAPGGTPYEIVLASWFTFRPWSSVIREFSTANTELLILDSSAGQVFAHTIHNGPAIKFECYLSCFNCEHFEPQEGNEAVDGANCFLHPNELGPTVSGAVNASKVRPRGTFFTADLSSTNMRIHIRYGEYFAASDVNKTTPLYKKDYFVDGSLDGGEYFLRLTHVYTASDTTFELLWMRTVSSVNDKVYAALVQLIIASVVIFVADLIIAVLEIVLIARPLGRLVVGNRFLETMDLDRAEAHMNAMYKPVMVQEVARVTDGLLMAIEGLREYKAFLPSSLLMATEVSHGELQEEMVAAPGLVTGTAALVFTDIQGSTATWEACPEGMREGLKVHNNVMRECLSEHNGYEVKTIGDSFMVAFEDACGAVSFSLSAQEKLLEGAWPQELLFLEHCAWNNDGPWCGLRVRIGVHFGEVDVQLNTLTGRYDYFGNTVNKAARMEGACVGGAVAVTEEVMGLIEVPASGAVVIPMGEVKLNGVTDPVHPFILLPENLSFRAPFIESQLLLSIEDRRQPIKSLSWSMHSTHEIPVLSTSSASVGLLEMELSDTCNAAETSLVVNKTLAKVMMCTERSHGMITSVQGSRVAIDWNTSRPCLTHIENSFSFVVTLHRMVTHSKQRLHIGLSNSEVKHGTVGVREQKFVTVLGRCVDVAGSLCSLGVKDDVFCLYGGVAEELCAMDEFRSHLHAEAAVSGFGLNVYEVRVQGFEPSELCENLVLPRV